MLLPTLNIVTLEKVEKWHYLLNYFFTSSMRDIVLSEIVQNFINDIEPIYKKVVNMCGPIYHKLFRCNLITSDPNVQDATCTQSALDCHARNCRYNSWNNIKLWANKNSWCDWVYEMCEMRLPKYRPMTRTSCQKLSVYVK